VPNTTYTSVAKSNRTHSQNVMGKFNEKYSSKKKMTNQYFDSS